MPRKTPPKDIGNSNNSSNTTLQSSPSFGSPKSPTPAFQNHKGNSPTLSSMQSSLKALSFLPTPNFRLAAEQGQSAIHSNSFPYPENTLAAFTAASTEEEMNYVSFPIRMTFDNHLVVIESEELGNLFGMGKVSKTKLEDLKVYDIGSHVNKACANERIPTLIETFNTLKKLDMTPIVEVKFSTNPVSVEMIDNYIQKLMSTINERWPNERAIIIASDNKLFQQRFYQARKSKPNIVAAFIPEPTQVIEDDYLKLIQNLQPALLYCDQGKIDEDSLNALELANLKFAVKDLNDIERAANLLALNVLFISTRCGNEFKTGLQLEKESDNRIKSKQ